VNEDPVGPPTFCCFLATVMIIVAILVVICGLLFMGDTLTR
jgi:t-SNARE complex subunit (syntaxin)